jgi:L-lactate dehydrogenase complex protein LldG
LEDVDLFIARGEFGVAENAAVWVTDTHTRHRVLYFLTQHLVLVLSADQIVDNMHQAYERLQFTEPRFGLFLSGPSKTADIEQSLVIGAHGARSLTVFLIGDGNA